MLQKQSETYDVRLAPRTTSRARVHKSIFVEAPKGFVEPYRIFTIPAHLKTGILHYIRKDHDISTKTIYNDLHGFIEKQQLHKMAYTELHKGFTSQERGDAATTNTERRKLYEDAIAYYAKAIDLKPDLTEASSHLVYTMLHLISQGYTDFKELKELLGLDYHGSYYALLLGRIVRKIAELEEEWGESIPPITALVFRADGTATAWACERLTGNSTTQPTAKQITELKESVAAYDRWDEVLKALKP